MQGAILGGERSDRTSALLLVDVTPLSLGVEVQGKAMSTIVRLPLPIQLCVVAPVPSAIMIAGHEEDLFHSVFEQYCAVPAGPALKTNHRLEYLSQSAI